MTLRHRHYLLAALVALTLHVIAAAVLLWRPAPPEGAAIAAGAGGIEIALGPAGSERGEAQTVDVDVIEPVAPETIATSEPPPQALPEREAIAEPPAMQDPEPRPAEDPEPQVAAEALPRPSSKVPQTETPSPAPADAAGRGGTREAEDIGSGDASPGGGVPGATRDYAAILLAWLERHKEYPRRARLRRQEGTAMLYLMIDRDGRVLDYRLEKSSNHPMLDEEVLAMIQRAQPLPAMPEELAGNQLELIVPVEFFLR